MKKPKCFKCENSIKPAVVIKKTEDIWELPCGVSFEGGYNFGSSLYDTMRNGVAVQIIICDECIKAAQGTAKLRELKKEGKFPSTRT